MKYEQYLSLIQRLELSAARSRRNYELKVFGLGLLGYAYMIGLIALFLLLPVGLILIVLINPGVFLQLLLWTVKLWWAALPGLALYFGFVGGAVKALFTKMPEPEGRVLEKEEAPELYSFVADTCEKLKSDIPKCIYITDEFNAAVATVPKFGLFGSKVYMFIGLPLLRALSPEQFKAVLAHEIGHISGRHGGFGKWAYQLRGSWGLFIDSQELQDHKFAVLYRDFVEWFFPYFQAYSFVLMREHEKEADQYAAEITGATPLAEALISLHTRSAELQQVFWAKIEKENQESEHQPTNVFSQMLSALSFVDTSRDTKALEKAIQIPTDYNDSHPSLDDRLKLLGYWKGEGLPRLPSPAAETAADHFLGDVCERLVSEFETRWAEEIAKTWKQRHEEFRASRERFDALESKSAGDSLTTDEMIEKAGLLAQREGNEAALPLLRQAFEQEPDHPEANYVLGGVLLSLDDEAGLGYVQRSMDLDKKWKFAASDVAFQYLRSKGRLEEAKPYAEILDNYNDEMRVAEVERQSISTGDTFIPHTFNEEKLAEIIRKIKYYEEVTRMYLVRKQTQYFSDIDFHVLFLELRERSFRKNRDDMKPTDLLAAVADRLSNTEIGFFQLVDEHFKPVLPEIGKVPGAIIFDREKETEIHRSGHGP